MTIRDGVGLNRWENGLFDKNNEDSVSLLYRLIALFTWARNEAFIYVNLNEAGRPEGVASDIDIGRAGLPEWMTASGVSTIAYQWGRHLLWLDTGGAKGTPSAAVFGGTLSKHTIGVAADLDSNDYARLAAYARRLGLKQTILPSEIWHFEIVDNPEFGADYFARFSAVVRAVFGEGDPPPTETEEQRLEKELMGAREDIREDVRKLLAEAVMTLKNVMTRERWQLAKVKNRDTIWALNMWTGAFDQYPNMAELLKDVRLEKVSSFDNNDGNGRQPEPQMIFETIEELRQFVIDLRVDLTKLPE